MDRRNSNKFNNNKSSNLKCSGNRPYYNRPKEIVPIIINMEPILPAIKLPHMHPLECLVSGFAVGYILNESGFNIHEVMFYVLALVASIVTVFGYKLLKWCLTKIIKRK